MELTSRMKMTKISNLLDPNAKKPTFGQKSQNWPNHRDENDILIFAVFTFCLSLMSM
ncbi:hypothetical protein Hanom_Chr10g00943781 [Helianthus anomalus]